ncbi:MULTISPECIES: hypothetical protein [Streptomyces]|uniref:hypothetical protein n=1 Tax=Streptomyces TaxID=1883 RepID=UPI001317120A|nr:MULTISPECIES: hypothetical protein [Streptomyces]QGZ52421.1 hypothetical protein GPZ77_32465 [Streptomyces sp. QHH-9511]GGT85248.1 hypothetical protein GCM10010272_32500 [Streptomyces lateritius]
MGDCFQTIADIDATAEEAGALGARVVTWLVTEGIVRAERRYEMLGRPVYSPGPRWDDVTEWTNEGGCDGLAVITDPTVFRGSLGSDGSAVCPHCSARATAAPWPEAAEIWHRTGTAELPCPVCDRMVPLPEWTWEGDRFAFAHLGFEIWNAARPRPEFVAEFGRVLGHRIRTVAGKL